MEVTETLPALAPFAEIVGGVSAVGRVPNKDSSEGGEATARAVSSASAGTAGLITKA